MSYSDMDIKEGDGKYLRVSGGQTITFHILSKEPVKKMVHWVSQKKVDCAGSACVLCREGNQVKQRWLTNVMDRKDETVKIFEFGPSIAKQIKANSEALAEDLKTVHDVDFRIKADGAKLDTEYTVMQKLMGAPIPGSVELHDLK